MTALKGKAIADFVRAGATGPGAVLVYGPDQGLVRERADQLARTVVADFKDPFNYIELSDADLKSDTGRLADEAAALSFAGGLRVVRLRTAGEASAAAAKTLVEGLDAGRLKANALVVIEAGDLAKSSGLRKLFEKSKEAVALACYADQAADIRSLALDAARAEDLRFEDDALSLLASLLGDDRGVSRSEIGKLFLFKGLKSQRSGPGIISVEDVKATLADGVGDALDEAAGAAADGAADRLERALWKSAMAGASPISLIRALARSFHRLHEAQARIAEGASAADAMMKLRPPVFFMEQRPFEARLRRWPLRRLDDALDLLIAAEFDAKSTGAPQKEIAERAALRLAVMAGR
ncbi:MAG: DNA polymerase III subunit delta [Parvularculaceae bacterium]